MKGRKAYRYRDRDRDMDRQRDTGTQKQKKIKNKKNYIPGWRETFVGFSTQLAPTQVFAYNDKIYGHHDIQFSITINHDTQYNDRQNNGTLYRVLLF